jgi:hypothetical protein
MNEPLILIGRSQIRVSNSLSSETRLHRKRVGTTEIVAAILIGY